MNYIISRSSFFKMSRQNRRIAIAKDILFRLKSSSFFAESGSFARVSGKLVEFKSDDEYTTRDVENSHCEVCAKGAIACSWFINLNKHKFTDFDLDNNETDAMKEVIDTFGENLWDTIESIFENWGVDERKNDYSDEEKSAIDDYSDRLWEDGSAQHVMEKIFSNIIRNKGNLLIPRYKKKGFLITE